MAGERKRAGEFSRPLSGRSIEIDQPSPLLLWLAVTRARPTRVAEAEAAEAAAEVPAAQPPAAAAEAEAESEAATQPAGPHRRVSPEGSRSTSVHGSPNRTAAGHSRWCSRTDPGKRSSAD